MDGYMDKTSLWRKSTKMYIEMMIDGYMDERWMDAQMDGYMVKPVFGQNRHFDLCPQQSSVFLKVLTRMPKKNGRFAAEKSAKKNKST